MITSHREARQYLLDYLKRDLVGPVAEDEVLTDAPNIQYLAGILYPQNAFSLPQQEEEADDSEAPVDEDEPDTGVPLVNARLPSAIGISFTVEGLMAPFSVKVNAAYYIPETTIIKKVPETISESDNDELRPQEGASELYSSEALPTETTSTVTSSEITDSDSNEAELSDIKTGEQTEDSVSANKPSKLQKQWHRHPVSWSGEFVGNTQLPPVVVSPGLELRSTVRSVGSNRSVTITLVNTYQAPGNSTPAEMCFFQPQIEVTINADSGIHFLARERIDLSINDEDVARNRLLYRHAREYAVGHGCAAQWFPVGNQPPETIYSAIVPDYEVPQVVAQEGVQSQALDMAWLALAARDEMLQALEILVQHYMRWIEERELELSTLSGQFEKAGKDNLARCREALVRMRQGITLLGDDVLVREAFQLANQAMHDQRQQSLHIAGKTMVNPPKWRLFQLAFMLICLPSIANYKDDFRDTVDLLWFPTGGGKTEAYLGLTAFTIMLRRIRACTAGNPAQGSGTAILMRYTLRLLTIQQFQRANALICALELIRRKNPGRYGTDEIASGLWVGGTATPNTLKNAEKALEKLKKGEEVYEGNPVQLLKCSWCGVALKPDNYHVPPGAATMIIKCSDKSCPFNKSLPVYVIDDDIYLKTPALIIGTVDKFARLPWKEEAGRLFGHGTSAKPPELIIQDELHLISGPLGTLVGLYETAVDILSTDGEIRPKVIASTATIRRADEQSLALFNRKVRQFPPPGLDARDSFFAVAVSLEIKPGRLYAGVHASGNNSTKTTLLRIYAALLQGIFTMDAPDTVRDAYWTLVGYFNSLRELGGTVRLVEDDVPARIGILAKRESRHRRFINREVELTSRRSSTEIGELLEQMTNSLGDRKVIDVLLATNMISVGVDIDRLGLMVVGGQPKTTAEYIQATSRVGRQHPGFVITSYNPSRPRDRSHYERFVIYHSSIYSQVEATSVTPFSGRARDRGLHGVAVAALRHLISGITGEMQAGNFNPSSKYVREIISKILERVNQVDPDERDNTEEELEEILSRWKHLAEMYNELRYGRPFGGTGSPPPHLLYQAEEEQSYYYTFPTLNSLREVEPSTKLYMIKTNPRGRVKKSR